MPKPSKPTGAQLYRRFMKGFSIHEMALDNYTYDWEIEHAIRAYLRLRDARRKSDAR